MTCLNIIIIWFGLVKKYIFYEIVYFGFNFFNEFEHYFNCSGLRYTFKCVELAFDYGVQVLLMPL